MSLRKIFSLGFLALLLCVATAQINNPSSSFNPATPGAIGGTTPAAGTFTTLAATTGAQPQVSAGAVGSSSGQLGLNGTTSGTATFTAPAVAGTATNGVTASNVLWEPDGTASFPAYSFANCHGCGLWNNGGNPTLLNMDGSHNGPTLQNSSTTFMLSSGNAGATLSTGTLTAPSFTVSGKCAGVGTGASPSLVACSAASAGQFSCATNASTATCVISSTAVTTTSVILIQPNAGAGSILSVVCNTTADTGLTAPRLASWTTGSFTINLGTFSSNPLCFDFVVE